MPVLVYLTFSSCVILRSSLANDTFQTWSRLKTIR